ncbi:MAG: hypothetical protein ABI175_14300, partial [Polyangiales bacterium]
MTPRGSLRAPGDRRRFLRTVALGAALMTAGCPGNRGDGFPSEKTPEGAYVRVALAIAEGDETEAPRRAAETLALHLARLQGDDGLFSSSGNL